MFVIDDSTKPSRLYPKGMARGLDLRDRPNRDSYGYGAAADPFPKSLLIPRNEWQARIKEMEEQKSRCSDMFKQAGGRIKFQNPLSYCWIFAVTSAIEHACIAQGMPYESLSPASAGARIKNFQDVGGWGKEALEWIIANGINTTEEWPDTSLERSLLTAAMKASAMKRRATEWWELQPRNDDQLVSCLLRRKPVAIGLNWWGHEVLAVDPVWVNGAIAVRFQNSYDKDWEDEGYGVLQGDRMKADDAVVARVVMAT